MWLRGPFANFVDSPYYSDSELYGGAVTVYFSKYLPWQATHVLQRSAYFSKKCCRPVITSKFLASELSFYVWKSPEIAWGEIWTVWRMFWWGSIDSLFRSRTRNSIQISPHAISGLSIHEKGAPKQEISKWWTVCSTFSRNGWSVVRCASLSKGGTPKIDRHRTSTKFRLGVIRWIRELYKRSSFINPKCLHSSSHASRQKVT
jgi:hypothetical protein